MSGNLELKVLLAAIDKASGPLKNISAAGKATAQAIKATQEALKGMERQAYLAKSHEALRTKMLELRAAMQRVRAAGDAMPTGLQKSMAETRAKLAASRAEMQAAGISTRRLSQTQADLAGRIAAANAQIQRQSGELGRIVTRHQEAAAATRKFHRALEQSARIRGAGFATMGVGATGLVAGGFTVKAFADQEDAATRLKLSMMRELGAIPPEFEKVNALAQELGNMLPGTTADFQRMMQMLMRQGVSAETVLAGTGRAAAYLAVMLEKTPAEAAEFAAKLQDATGTAAKDMTAMADTIQRVFYLGVDPSNMLGAYASLSPGMDIIKQKGLAGAQAMAPLIAMLDQASLSGESAGNALRKVFSRSFGATPKAMKAIKAGGLSFVDKKGEFKGLDNMFAQFEKLRKFSTAKRLDILGTIWGDDSETLQAINTMIEKGKAGYDEMRAKMQAQADQQTRINLLLGTLKNVWDAASGAFVNLLATLGSLLSPELKALATWFGEASAKISAWAAANPQLARTIAMVAASVAVLTVALGALAVVFSFLKIGGALLAFSGISGAIAGIATRAIPALVVALNVLRVAVMANPVGALISVLVGAAAYLLANWAPVGPYFSNLWSQIVAGASVAWGRLVAGFAAIPGEMASIGSRMMDGLINGIGARLGHVWAKIQEVAAGIKANFRAMLQIQSPSRVFVGYGTQILAGLTQGLERTAGVPLATIGRIATGVALAGATALQPAPLMASPRTAAVGGGGDTITIQIHAAAGQDPRAIAQEVERVLAARDRRKQAARRAALYDLD